MMKKFFATLLAVLLLLSLTACKDKTPPLAVEAGDVYTNYSAVHIAKVTPVAEDGQIALTLQIQNDSEYLVTYGESFQILRQEGDGWVDLELPEGYGFMEIAHLLEAGKTAEQTYDVTFYYGVDGPGTYRLKTQGHADEPEKSIRFQLWADFTVTQ